MRLRIRFSFILYLLFIVILSSPMAACSALSALAVHEAGHLLAGRLMGETFKSIELTPFGGIIRYTSEKSGCKGMRGIAIAAAGPAANYLTLLVLSLEPLQGFVEHRFLSMMFVANLSMLLLNLLPALPLDGGRVVLSAGFYFFNAFMLISVLCNLGYITGGFMILFAGYGLTVYRILNCSLVIVGIYLIVYARHSRMQLMYENAYAIIHDRQRCISSVRRIHLYEVKPDIQLHKLLAAVMKSDSSAFLYNDNDGIHFVHESDFLNAFLDSPTMTIQKAGIDISNFRIP